MPYLELFLPHITNINLAIYDLDMLKKVLVLIIIAPILLFLALSVGNSIGRNKKFNEKSASFFEKERQQEYVTKFEKNQAEIPQNFPQYLHYPKFDKTAVIVDNNEKQQYGVVYMTDDSLDKITTYYQQVLKLQGFHTTDPKDVTTDSSGRVKRDFRAFSEYDKKPEVVIDLFITQWTDFNTIQIQYQQKL
ncbi:MAG: hypothetical protein UU90_C0006G0018 [candidate division WWE3 bacterium GW2011_GWD2_42_11]|nr:MAG: hypothetical protein UU90_C0006G0018 [candidate division WWE3 bacterium GW2011_GWD2_42_11]